MSLVMSSVGAWTGPLSEGYTQKTGPHVNISVLLAWFLDPDLLFTLDSGQASACFTVSLSVRI